jgi:hypothetical protein
MASNTELYSLVFATVGNAILAEAQTIDLKRIGGGQIVGTIAKRFAGISPGMSLCQISIESAVPAAGFEYDPGDVIDGYVPVKVGIAGPGGKTAKSVGFIMEDQIKGAMNAPSGHTMMFTGSYPSFE